MMMESNALFMKFGSLIATLMFVKAMFEQYIPQQWRDSVHTYLHRFSEKIVRVFSPYLHITFEEYSGEERFDRSEAYTTIETYLSEKMSEKARALKGNFVKGGKNLVLGLADNEEVTDEFQGVKVWWKSYKIVSRGQTITFYPGGDEQRKYQLSFHGRHRKLVTETYLRYIIDEGKAIAVRKRQRKLFTNLKEQSCSYYGKSTLWSHVEFKHPASFNTIGMNKSKKTAIINDLVRFSKAKDYYAKIGKPWKRGYLLYGPPGTGKSTMIAAIANLLEYDIYDLELTSVKDNTQLRRLLIETSNKSIIVIEDIDCSLDLTGQRKNKEEDEKIEEEDKNNVANKLLKKEEGLKKISEVTLSGLLNFIDGIWSACGEERLIIFTTNHIEKLDPALIRRGRMDMHIELSYCCYEAFKVLAYNYLGVESHPLFDTIKRLLEETEMNPADVAESLMPKSLVLDVELCLRNLVDALEKAKLDQQLKAAEEAKREAEGEAKVEEEAIQSNCY